MNTKFTRDENGLCHSYNDEPAMTWHDGDKAWCKHGKVHRENKPAYISKNYKLYYYEDKINIETTNEPMNNIIIINDNLIAIILNKTEDENVYFCLIENEKRYVKCI